MRVKRGPKRLPIEASRGPARAEGWDPPGHLSEDARDAWRHVVSLLARVGNLGRTDPVLVELYAINAALLRRAYAATSADGLMVEHGNGTTSSHPAIKLINLASMRLKSIIKELGLSPASSKFAASTPPVFSEASEEESAKWRELLAFDPR